MVILLCPAILASVAAPSDSGAARADEGFWVAVLPFKHGGSSGDLAALADGLTDDTITGLSRFSYLRVIARSSSSRYVSQSVDVRTAGKELNARYVMEGTLRQAGSRLRLGVQQREWLLSLENPVAVVLTPGRAQQFGLRQFAVRKMDSVVNCDQLLGGKGNIRKYSECLYLERILGNDLILISLRDFFAARDGRAMAAACATLTKAAPPADGHPASAGTADELEYAFNRLFVGPGTVPAPPYASVYLDPDHGLMGESTRIAAAVYDALGVSSPSSGSLPDDHLALELDAAVAFHALKARGQSAELAALWDYFLRDHLMLWVPLFVARIKQVPDVPPAISHVASLLSAWLSEESGAKPVTQIPTLYPLGDFA